MWEEEQTLSRGEASFHDQRYPLIAILTSLKTGQFQVEVEVLQYLRLSQDRSHHLLVIAKNRQEEYHFDPFYRFRFEGEQLQKKKKRISSDNNKESNLLWLCMALSPLEAQHPVHRKEEISNWIQKNQSHMESFLVHLWVLL
jgi:hypothetical protein